jgi:hypothetical protein
MPGTKIFATVVVMLIRNVTFQNAAHGTKFSAGYDGLLPATKSGDRCEAMTGNV